MIAVCRSRRDFRRLSVEGRVIRRHLVWARVVVDPSMTESRLAFALGRHLGGAVTRNRVRRRLRAIVHHHHQRVPSGLFMLGATPAAVRAGFAPLEADIERLLADIGSVDRQATAMEPAR